MLLTHCFRIYFSCTMMTVIPLMSACVMCLARGMRMLILSTVSLDLELIAWRSCLCCTFLLFLTLSLTFPSFLTNKRVHETACKHDCLETQHLATDHKHWFPPFSAVIDDDGAANPHRAHTPSSVSSWQRSKELHLMSHNRQDCEHTHSRMQRNPNYMSTQKPYDSNKYII